MPGSEVVNSCLNAVKMSFICFLADSTSALLTAITHLASRGIALCLVPPSTEANS